MGPAMPRLTHGAVPAREELEAAELISSAGTRRSTSDLRRRSRQGVEDFNFLLLALQHTRSTVRVARYDRTMKDPTVMTRAIATRRSEC
jgi:hypothetical protein